jgi:asparagine synthase (glutamine-hydrolysing)
MPGIAGLISRQPPDVCRRLVEQMTASMQHEKFHVSSTYDAAELGVFAGSVSLEGSFADCQPLVNEAGDIALLVAGECFSDHKTDRNAAWLIDLYERSGEKFFETLNGLFSGLLIDRRRQKAFLFNDRYGFERLYYHERRDGFFFASEAKALLRVLPEVRAFDDEGLRQFLQYGCTLHWKSLFRHVGIVPGASLWAFTPDEKCKRDQYFSQASWESQPSEDDESFAGALGRALLRILPRYFESDRTTGISLTGGLDSRMIMACRPSFSRNLVSYTFAGPAGDTVDVRLASEVARTSGVPHHVLRLGHDFFTNFASLADRTVSITDGYLDVCGTHEIYLNREARELSPVRLTGNFGSEILRGTTTFKPLDLAPGLLHPDLRQALGKARVKPDEAAEDPTSFAAFGEIPWHLFGLARAGQSQVTTRIPYLDNDLVMVAFRAPKQLRKSASPALQVIRDGHSQLARIRTDSGLLPSSRLSSILGALWYRPTFKIDYWRNVELPKSLWPLDIILSGLPLGASLVPRHRYLHYRRWFRSELADYLRERLTDSQVLRSHLWNAELLVHLAEDHISGRKNYLREITTVLTCSAIERLLFHATA